MDEKRKCRYFWKMKKSLFIIGLMLIVAAVFEFSPAVEYWRVVVPEDAYVGKSCDCDCIMESRPWYSRFNYWFWLWVIGAPIIVFSVRPTTPRWQRSIRTLVAIGFCYAVMNLALHLMWDIRNGPFWVVSGYSWQKSWDDPGTKCANIADGASILFTALFGWIYATIYTGWWEMAWHKYYERKRLIDSDFCKDIFSKLVSGVSYVVAKLALFTIIALPFAIVIFYLLEKLEILKGYQSFFP